MVDSLEVVNITAWMRWNEGVDFNIIVHITTKNSGQVVSGPWADFIDVPYGLTLCLVSIFLHVTTLKWW